MKQRIFFYGAKNQPVVSFAQWKTPLYETKIKRPKNQRSLKSVKRRMNA